MTAAVPELRHDSEIPHSSDTRGIFECSLDYVSEVGFQCASHADDRFKRGIPQTTLDVANHLF